MDDRYSFIPQYTAYAAAGGGHDNPHVEIRSTLAFKRDWLRLKGANPKNLKVIYADGNSMWPTISDRDVLLVDESKIEPRDGQIFVLESVAKGTIVKRLVKSDFGGWIIRSDNPDKINNADLELPDGEIHEHRILGRVIWRGGDL
ncbi:Peptidase S24-like [Pseudomonas sp. NFPP07]|nr:Peptidase S24-like [Pseudomonas sp. NFPP07]